MLAGGKRFALISPESNDITFSREAVPDNTTLWFTLTSKVREADNYTRTAGQSLLAKSYAIIPYSLPSELDLNEF